MPTISFCSNLQKGFRLPLAALLLCSLALSGCASKYGAQTTKVENYPDCYEPIAQMRKSEYGIAKSAAAGAVIGGLLGAVGGYLATGKTQGAVIGAAAGAAVGGAAGAYKGKRDQDQEDAARMAEYAAQLDTDISEVDKATAGAKVARLCYERQFAVAASEYKSGHISKEQFKSRYTEVTSGMQEAAFILGETNKYSQKVASQYKEAVNVEANRMGVNPEAVKPKAKTAAKSTSKKETPTAQKPPSKAEQREASAKLQTEEGRQLSKLAEKSAGMDKSVADAQEEERLLRERLAATNKAAEDLMS